MIEVQIHKVERGINYGIEDGWQTADYSNKLTIIATVTCMKNNKLQWYLCMQEFHFEKEKFSFGETEEDLIRGLFNDN